MKKRYAGDQRHVIAGDRQHVADAGYKQRVVNVWRDRVAKRAGRGRHHGGPKRRLALRGEVENDAGGHRQPRTTARAARWSVPARPIRGCARGNQIARATNGSRACPARCRAMAGAAARATVLSRRPGAARFFALCFCCHGAKAPARLRKELQSFPFRSLECNRQLWRRPKVNRWVSLWIGRPSNRSISRPRRLWLRLSPRYRAIRPCD